MVVQSKNVFQVISTVIHPTSLSLCKTQLHVAAKIVLQNPLRSSRSHISSKTCSSSNTEDLSSLGMKPRCLLLELCLDVHVGL